MEIVREFWSAPAQYFKIKCECGHFFEHPVSIQRVVCPHCGYEEVIHRIKEAKENVG